MNELEKRFRDELSNLNHEQQLAVLKCILADNYHMVLGTPGSGKTQAIVTLIRILTAMNKKVLVVSFTNQAIDNVLLRLKATDFDKFIRVTNNLQSVNPLLHDNVRTGSKFTNMEQIHKDITGNNVYGATCLQMNN